MEVIIESFKEIIQYGGQESDIFKVPKEGKKKKQHTWKYPLKMHSYTRVVRKRKKRNKEQMEHI